MTYVHWRGVTQDNKIDRTFADGAQPDPFASCQPIFFSYLGWEIKSPSVRHLYDWGYFRSQGMRLSVNGQRIVDEWRNNKELTVVRPFLLKAGDEVAVRVEYSQRNPTEAYN